MNGTAGPDEVTDATFDEEVLGADRPVLVEFTSDHCPPCKQMVPVLDAVAAETDGRMRVVQLDVGANPGTTRAYQVMGTPTMLVFRDGVRVKSMVGARSRRRLLQELEDVL
ncbi:thioredoxin family protein [Nocardiopsis sp. NPDC058631]|uniref:thioredoxin family protein n=1 Tax=Nocardiopsis sp. NPDC058631 TaxID=3346566 RepID=UPI003648F914